MSPSAPNFIDGANIGVLELAGGAGLAEESIEGNFVRRQVPSKQLDRHIALDHRIVRFEYEAHAALSEKAGDLILAQRLANPACSARINTGSRRIAVGASAEKPWSHSMPRWTFSRQSGRSRSVFSIGGHGQLPRSRLAQVNPSETSAWATARLAIKSGGRHDGR